MNTTLNYLIEANFGLLLFFMAYKLWLSNETQFSYRRYYLLGSMMLSLVFPLIKLPELKVVPSLSESIPGNLISEQTPVAIAGASTTLSYTTLFTTGYLLVAGFLLLRLSYRVIKLFTLAYKLPSCHIVEVHDPRFIAFSFFNKIFISTAYPLSELDKRNILNHEAIHGQKLHSLDILLAELIHAVFWFNPVLPLYKKELRLVHEFEADEATVQDREADTYCNLLARAALHSAGFSVGNHFNNALTLKRIAMIRTIKKSIHTWKITLIFLFTTGLFTIVSCREQLMEEVEHVTETTTIAGDFPDHMKPHVNRIIKENPGIKLMYVEAESMNADKIKSLNKEDIMYSNYEKYYAQDGSLQGERVGLIVRTGGTITNLAEATKSEDEVFLVAEEPASPLVGITGFYQEIMKNLNYPEEARRNNVTGRVFVELIIEMDGTMSNFKLLRGIGSGCDEEAVRAIKAVNLRWNPAKQRGVPVRSKFVIPIIFHSDNNR
ncbi:MAG: M56 family metallopeptidase [Cyclobacteriaceae bacterium]|nr:M56 family metallopeptidase [Cyclobacteriaceae bacterium]